MRKGFLTFLSALGVMAAGPLLIFILLFLLTWREYPVPKTVLDDPLLPRVVINQVTLHAESWGSETAPVLICVHDGPGGDYRSLLALKSLSDRFRVIFYDQRGSGLSARVATNRLSIAESLKELEGIADHFSPGRPVYLFGHGWGGMLAAAYARRYPQRVRGLILAEPGFLNTEMAQRIMPDMLRSSARFIVNAALSWIKSLHIHGPDNSAAEDFVFAQIRYQPRYHCEGQKPRADSSWRAGFKAWKIITQSTFSPEGKISIDFIGDLKTLSLPVLFLVSECNRLTGIAFQQEQMRLFAQAEMVQIRHSGHELLLDNPQETLSHIRRYLNHRLAALSTKL